MEDSLLYYTVFSGITPYKGGIDKVKAISSYKKLSFIFLAYKVLTQSFSLCIIVNVDFSTFMLRRR